MIVYGKYEPVVVPEMVSTINRPATKTILIFAVKHVVESYAIC